MRMWQTRVGVTCVQARLSSARDKPESVSRVCRQGWAAHVTNQSRCHVCAGKADQRTWQTRVGVTCVQARLTSARDKPESVSRVCRKGILVAWRPAHNLSPHHTTQTSWPQPEPKPHRRPGHNLSPHHTDVLATTLVLITQTSWPQLESSSHRRPGHYFSPHHTDVLATTWVHTHRRPGHSLSPHHTGVLTTTWVLITQTSWPQLESTHTDVLATTWVLTHRRPGHNLSPHTQMSWPQLESTPYHTDVLATTWVDTHRRPGHNLSPHTQTSCPQLESTHTDGLATTWAYTTQTSWLQPESTHTDVLATTCVHTHTQMSC